MFPLFRSSVKNIFRGLFAYIGKSYKDKNNIKYKIVAQEYNENGQPIIVAQLVNSPREVLKSSAIELAKDQEQLSKFSAKDIISIACIANTEKEPIIIYTQSTVYKYYSLLAMLFGCMLIISNIISVKLASFFGITITCGSICYPLTYILGDIITEVYGYKRARQLIWGAVICNLLLVFFVSLSIATTPSMYWPHQEEYILILGAVPRIIFASLIAYGCGEFTNSYIIARLKMLYKGDGLFARILSATIISVTLDTLVFITIAYSGMLPFANLLGLALTLYTQKVVTELFMIPVTMWAINTLKNRESADMFDYNTNFTPFSLDVQYLESDNKMSDKFVEPNSSSEFQAPYHISNLGK